MDRFINLNVTRQEKLVFDKPGKYIVYLHNLSGSFTVELTAPNVNVDIFGLFTGKKSEQFNIATVQHHKAPATTSNLFIKGVFDNDSKFNYQGLIRIEKRAQKSHAYQKNQNLILSPNVNVESKPFLEILANDVFCTHGSTTGQLNEEELFYAKSRGLSSEESKKLLIAGFIGDIFDKISKLGFEKEAKRIYHAYRN